MTIWKTGLVIAPLLIAAMAITLRRKRALSQGVMVLVLVATAAITAVLLSM